MTFCTHFQLEYLNPTSLTVCLYIEFLARTFHASKAIRNYVSGIALLHRSQGLSAQALESYDVQLMLRAVKRTVGDNRRAKDPFSVTMLLEICQACDSLGTVGKTCKCVFLFAFFGFLRASNLLAPSTSKFDARRHLCRGDVVFQPPGVVLIIKWTKTRQTPGYYRLLPLPALATGHPLCPLHAYQDMLAFSPGLSRDNTPAFVMPSTGLPLTSPHVRTILATILASLGYDSASFSLHSFRKAGATFCYNAGMDIARIKTHGDWKSDAVWRYIAPDFKASASVAADMATAVLSVTPVIT